MPQLYTYDFAYGNNDPYRDGGLFTSAFAAENYLRETFGSPVGFDRDYYGRGDTVYRRIVRPATWQEREQGLLDAGAYALPVWHREDWWQNRPAALREHFTHVSVADPTMIAFTENAAKGEADRQTRMKPGKYLKKFFGETLADKKIAYFAEWHRTGSQPPLDFDGGMHLATTESEVIEVYGANINSCMEDEDCVRVYAAGDLAVAYWVDEDSDTVARCLAWPERGVYGRTYPEPNGSNAGTALVQAMEARGWVHARVHAKGFNGARIQRIDTDCGFVMPYLDLGYGVTDRGDHFTMETSYEYSCSETGGYIEGPSEPDWHCSSCDDGYDEDDDSYSVSTYLNTWGAAEDRTYCRSCRDRETFRCEGSDELWDDSVSTVEVDGDTWAAPYAAREADRGNIFQIADGEYTSCAVEFAAHAVGRLADAILAATTTETQEAA